MTPSTTQGEVEVPIELLTRLRADYLRDCREKVDLVRQQAQSLSTRSGFKTAFPILLYVTHQLKGSGGSYGFAQISDAAKLLHSRLSQQLEPGQPNLDPPAFAREVLSITETLADALKEAESSISGKSESAGLSS